VNTGEPRRLLDQCFVEIDGRSHARNGTSTDARGWRGGLRIVDCAAGPSRICGPRAPFRVKRWIEDVSHRVALQLRHL
jgi:hypothetical protein